MDWCVTGMLFPDSILQYVKILHYHWMILFTGVSLKYLNSGPDRGTEEMRRHSTASTIFLGHFSLGDMFLLPFFMTV